MSPSIVARVLVAVGAVAVAVGVYGLAGWPLAVIVAGAEAVAYGMLFVDVDGKQETPKGPQLSGRPIERTRR